MDFNKEWEIYEEKRKALVKANSNLLGVVLRDKEILADSILAEYKREYAESCDGKIPYDIPVLTDSELHQTRLYRFCSQLPKGGDLHVHDMALLPVCELIPLLAGCPEFCINEDHEACDLISVEEEEPVPEGYIRFSEAIKKGIYTEKELIKMWTVVGADQSGMDIWTWFEELFNRHAVLSDNIVFAEKYYSYAFRYYCRLNIQHVEIHIMLSESIDYSGDYIKMLQRVYRDVKKEYPGFTVKVIGAGVKADLDNLQMTKQYFLNTSYVQETIKDESDPEEETDFVIGFDLVNEEDTSLPLYKFAPLLLKAKTHYPDMNLYIHSGESLDAGNENLIDAYLLGASRVGHGLNLYRYPDLHRKYAEAEICLEVCPISNQTLGYTKDIRNHPATEYLRTGVALALCSDDPAYMENETLTDDYFAATVGWDLKLADLKQLGINSIMYSGLSDKGKTKALKYYGLLWVDFINRIVEHGV